VENEIGGEMRAGPGGCAGERIFHAPAKAEAVVEAEAVEQAEEVYRVIDVGGEKRGYFF
jgi:hypothetical protein